MINVHIQRFAIMKNASINYSLLHTKYYSKYHLLLNEKGKYKYHVFLSIK